MQPSQGRSFIDKLPQKKQDAIVRDVLLGRRSMHAIAKSLKISDTAVGRYMHKISEERRIAIVAQCIAESKIADAQEKAGLISDLGADTDADLKWVLRELKHLLESAKGDDDRALQLGALKEVRQSLMSLADLHGKLNKRLDVHLNLNESPQFIQLRKIILTVLDRHPEAKVDFLAEMKELQVTAPDPKDVARILAR